MLRMVVCHSSIELSHFLVHQTLHLLWHLLRFALALHLTQRLGGRLFLFVEHLLDDVRATILHSLVVEGVYFLRLVFLVVILIVAVRIKKFFLLWFLIVLHRLAWLSSLLVTRFFELFKFIHRVLAFFLYDRLLHLMSLLSGWGLVSWLWPGSSWSFYSHYVAALSRLEEGFFRLRLLLLIIMHCIWLRAKSLKWNGTFRFGKLCHLSRLRSCLIPVHARRIGCSLVWKYLRTLLRCNTCNGPHRLVSFVKLRLDSVGVILVFLYWLRAKRHRLGLAT